MKLILLSTELLSHTQVLLFYSSVCVSFLSALLLVMLIKARIKTTRSNAALALRNKEVEAQHQEIHQQKRALEELNGVKDKMFSIIAHDFRSPLNTIQGVLSLLHMDALSEDELHMLLPDLTRKVDASINLLDNLLHWSRSQMQGIKVNPSNIHLRKVINDTIAHMHQVATQKDILIQVFVDDSLRVHADLEMTRLIIRNLLSNAIKFSYEGHAIHIEAHQSEATHYDELETNNQAVVSITDFGVGIPEDVLQDLFARNGYSTKGTAQEKGTGLGLNLCQECVRLNGGEIWVNSSDQGMTNFSFSLPLVEAHEQLPMMQHR